MKSTKPYRVPSDKVLIKVDDEPPTWIEVPKSISKEDLDCKIQKYKDDKSKQEQSYKISDKSIRKYLNKNTKRVKTDVDEVPLSQILFNNSHH